MTGTLLDIENLHLRLPTERGMLHALRGVDLSLEAGRTLCLVGESGCGKSLTSMAIMGLLPRRADRSADRFALMGRDYAGDKPAAWAGLRGREMAMIFQDPGQSLNPTLTVGRQLTEAIRLIEKLGTREARARAIDMLTRVGIPEPETRLRSYPHEFSGGQRQRLMIAMALIGRPRLLIADEPTTALDVTIQAQILRLLAELQRDMGLAILLITHDLGVAAAIADDVAVMYAGRIVEAGPVRRIFGAPAHPYTHGLMQAVPVPGRNPPGTPLRAIPGRVPSLLQEVPGCAFRDRCFAAVPACAGDIPRQRFSGGGYADCTRPQEAQP